MSKIKLSVSDENLNLKYIVVSNHRINCAKTTELGQIQLVDQEGDSSKCSVQFCRFLKY